jgi:peptide/nickel transport system substrate-binding protein
MYKKLRFFFRFTTGLVRKYFLALGFGLLLGIVCFFVLPKLSRLLPATKSVLRIGIVGRYSLSDLPQSIQSKISIGLTTVDQSGLPGPGLASSWVATDSGKTYTFTLNPNFTWHDGSRLKSKDIQYNFTDVKIEYPDDSHIILRLSDSFSPLPTVVSRPVIKTITFPTRKYLGVGKYRISGFKRNGPYLESLTLLPPPDSSLPVLKYFFYPTQSQARTALKLGVLHSVEDMTDYADLGKWQNLTITSTLHTDRYVAVFFNVSDPMFTGTSGKNLRLALSYAVNKSHIAEERRAYGPISKTSWAYNPSIKKYEYDLTRAKSLLKNVEKLPESISLKVVPAYLETAENIKKDWEALGLKVDLQVEPDFSLDSYQAMVIAQAVPIDPDNYNLWHSTQNTTNIKGAHQFFDCFWGFGFHFYVTSDRNMNFLNYSLILAK